MGSKACIKVGGLTSEEFEIHRGVRQGYTLSPWFFLSVYGQCCEGGKRRFCG